jgi:hypothetical protein
MTSLLQPRDAGMGSGSSIAYKTALVVAVFLALAVYNTIEILDLSTLPAVPWSLLLLDAGSVNGHPHTRARVLSTQLRHLKVSAAGNQSGMWRGHIDDHWSEHRTVVTIASYIRWQT